MTLNIFASCSRVIIPTFCQRGFLSTTTVSRNLFDPKTFYEPILDKEQATGGLPQSDPRYFKYAKPMPSDATPVFYKDDVIDQLIRACMIDGKKEKAKELVYGALERIKKRQYKNWKKAKTEEEKAAIERNPVVIAKKGLVNLRPVLKLVNNTRGGIMYQVPMPVSESHAEWRAIKSLRILCVKLSKGGHRKKNKNFVDNLAIELYDAWLNKGKAIENKQLYHKRCEANKAYAHYLYKPGKG